MLNRKATIVLIIVWFIKKTIQMSEYFPEPKSFVGRMKVALDLSNYATKEDFKKCNKCWYIKIC